MSLIFFMNNFSKNVGTFLGTLCIYTLKISAKDLTHLNWLIIIHFSVAFLGFCLLMISNITNRKKATGNEEIEEFDNNYLAYINTKDSIILDDDDMPYERDRRNEFKQRSRTSNHSDDKQFISANEKQVITHKNGFNSDSIN